MINVINKTISGIIEIARGMFTIFIHIFRPVITQEYPEIKPEFNSRYRGRLALMVNPDGSDMCTGCQSCSKVCPCGDLIYIETERNEETKKLSINKFTIDMGRCIFCGNCTEVCPKNALIMTDEFELADYSREALVLDKSKLKLTVEQSESWRNRKEANL